jgi:hypothetical protein
MHNSSISKEFYNNITDVLTGKTTKKVELPESLKEAAKAAKAELATLTEGVMVAETKRNILRKHLKEGVAKCGCQLTPEMVVRFDEVVAEADTKMPTQKGALATPAKTASAINTAAMKKEETETSEIELGLREFLTQLSEQEVSTLRKIINETR